ncbi:MAG: SRPBCC family protein [Leptolyngbyaceae bacterium]|nr:SRPBCC family protein [Leptolyngbyaceae bacterium]
MSHSPMPQPTHPHTLGSSPVAPGEANGPLAMADDDADPSVAAPAHTDGDMDIQVKTEKLDGRRRQISATVQIPHGIEKVWTILTDYENLADFIPSLKQSRRLEHPANGIRIEQIGSESLLKIKFCARVVLDMVESFPHSLSFEMVEGDFKMFCGEWQLQPIEGDAATELTYTLRVWPSRLMPVSLIEKRLGQGLRANLSAIQRRADELFG